MKMKQFFIISSKILLVSFLLLALVLWLLYYIIFAWRPSIDVQLRKELSEVYKEYSYWITLWKTSYGSINFCNKKIEKGCFKWKVKWLIEADNILYFYFDATVDIFWKDTLEKISNWDLYGYHIFWENDFRYAKKVSDIPSFMRIINDYIYLYTEKDLEDVFNWWKTFEELRNNPIIIIDGVNYTEKNKLNLEDR